MHTLGSKPKPRCCPYVHAPMPVSFNSTRQHTHALDGKQRRNVCTTDGRTMYHNWGWPEPCIYTAYDRVPYIYTVYDRIPYIYTAYDRTYGEFPAKNTVYTPYIYGSGQP